MNMEARLFYYQNSPHLFVSGILGNHFFKIKRFLRSVSGTGTSPDRHPHEQGIKSFILRFLTLNASKLL
jgi:hypothetical protein